MVERFRTADLLWYAVYIRSGFKAQTKPPVRQLMGADVNVVGAGFAFRVERPNFTKGLTGFLRGFQILLQALDNGGADIRTQIPVEKLFCAFCLPKLASGIVCPK